MRVSRVAKPKWYKPDDLFPEEGMKVAVIFYNDLDSEEIAVMTFMENAWWVKADGTKFAQGDDEIIVRWCELPSTAGWVRNDR
jgi:hypothetical protein